MYKKAIALMLYVGWMACAHAQESVPLCSPPMDPDCIEPKWGQVDPQGLVGGTTAGSIAPAGEAQARGRIAMRLVEAPATSASEGAVPGQLKATIDGTALFRKETDALTAAIRKATFDRKGNIVTGEARIAAAAASARKVASNYALTLYIKAPAHLPDARQRLLSSKVASINGVLDRSLSRSDPKPKS